MTPLETVETFIARWHHADTFLPSIEEFFSADCLYENIGISKTVGPAEAVAFFKAFMQQIPLASLRVDMLAVAVNGDTVMTERIDHFVAADGSTLMSLQLMGIMKIRDGRLYEWRDYFDTKPFRP